ncbi:MAG: Ig-like domain-containing protein [Kofleriaceae bacterium]|nr:Ig-like domain-containing protein [Kofleriaceae bacterium]
MITGSCGSGQKRPPAGNGTGGGGDLVLTQPVDAPPGLELRLSNGRQGAPAADHSKLAPATKLGDADAQKLLAQLPAIKASADDQKDFALRAKSQPPPRTGKTVKGSFPPPPSKTAPPPTTNDQGKKLTVLRYAPEGEVPVAPQLQVTFSQPMVAVTSHDDTTAHGVPVTLTPTPKGTWRWVGSRTLLFDPDVRFPQATTYQVEIPKGTTSATGNVLDEAVRFSFETPPPTLQSYWPSGYPQKLDAPMYALFDQKIDPAAVLSHLEVTAAGKRYALELLDDAAITKDDTLKSLVESAKASDLDGRWLAFRATERFPKDTAVSIRVKAGTPSLEGPNPTKADQSWGFQTYAPLRIDDSYCGWHGSPCPPGTPFTIQFNNPLDVDKWDDGMITVTPAIPGAKIQQNGGWVSIYGRTQGRTKYTVTVSGGIVDGFAQTLGKDVTLTFKTGDAYPEFYGPSGMVVVDPASKTPTYDLFTTNYESLKVRLYQVEPKDFTAFATYMNKYWDVKRRPKLPGKKVFDQLIQIDGAKDTLTETHIDLTPALGKGKHGHVIAVVEPYPWKQNWDPPVLHTWLQVTQLAVDAYVDGGELIGWATKLGDGKALPGVQLEMAPHGLTATTDDQGLATIKLPGTSKKGAGMLIARQGDDVAFMLDDNAWWSDSSSWLKSDYGDQLRWYVTDDRQMYRPSEEVHLKGWLRRVGMNEGGDVAGVTGMVQSVHYKVVDPIGNELLQGDAKVDALGGFDTTFKLPDTPNLGYASVYFEAKGRLSGSYYHGFQIQEFRRPEYEVTASVSEGVHVLGTSADITATASYYAGGGLAGAPVNWWLTASETTFTPPNQDDYVFGSWTPWWGWRSWWDDTPYPQPKTWSHAATTDASGQHVLHVDFVSANPTVPMTVVANANVTDVNRQSWAAVASILVHPSLDYIGLKTARPFVERGDPIAVDGVVVDLDGKAAVGRPYELKTVRMDWAYEKGKYVTKEVDPQSCTGTAGADPFHCEFTTKEGGQYQITALTSDDQGRTNRTVMTVWVAGGDMPPARDVQQEQVNLIPNQKEYQDGDVAEILVNAPFYPAQGLMTVRRSGIVSSERFDLTGPTTTLRVPIKDAYVPNLFVQVDLVGKTARLGDDGQPATNLPDRPAYAMGVLNLPVPPKRRTLHVEVAPRSAKVEPGVKTQMDVAVTDAAGRPVAGAEVALMVVDESILALSGYQFPDPLSVFYQGRDAGARDYRYRGYVKLAKPDAAMIEDQTVVGGMMGGDGDTGAAYGAGFAEADEVTATRGAAPPPPPDAAPSPKSPAPVTLAEGRMGKKSSGHASANSSAGGQAPQPVPVAVRTNFDPLAAFAPAVMTSSDGKAVVDVKMPDNLTRYRVVAIAVAGERNFGKGESAVTARMPLMVRPSPPRFLNFGDRFELPVVVQNQTDAPMTVQVAVRATNATLTDGAGRQVQVPAQDRVEVRFPAAADLAGTARFQMVASAGRFSDAAELALPVWTPATTEAFATYGVIDSGAIRQPIALPTKVVEAYGGLEVETSSTQLQALTDAFLYLVTYPFECSEQISSRVLGIAALKDVLTAFKAEGLPPAAEIEARVDEDLRKLENMQNWDGGFPFWQRGYESWPFLSVHVANALVRAKQKGFAVDAEMLRRSQNYLQNIERYYPWYYSEDVKRTITSYALYVRKLMGDKDVARAKGLIKEAGGVSKLSMEAVGWLLGVVAGDASAATERKDILRHLDNKAVETAGAANWTTSYADGAYLLLASDRRVDAVILESLIQEAHDNDLIPKVVTGLLAHKKAGHWLNTQENVFVLLALDLYFHEYEKVTPDFVSKVWLGDGYAGDHTFQGRQTDRFQLDIPMKAVADLPGGKGDLTIQKAGKGRLYYRVGMSYAPADLKLAPADHGFVVDRVYEAVDDPADVTRAADGVWHVKAGARVRVRLTMVAESRRYHVALVDPLPAGLEPMNPALAVTGPVPQDPNQQQNQGRYWWWSRTWYEHQNLRDERVEAFTSLLWEGIYDYTYVARATTPGTFVVPPTKAEEMYMPETFGRSGTDRVVVE